MLKLKPIPNSHYLLTRTSYPCYRFWSLCFSMSMTAGSNATMRISRQVCACCLPKLILLAALAFLKDDSALLLLVDGIKFFHHSERYETLLLNITAPF
jgi:hypothetical protein